MDCNQEKNAGNFPNFLKKLTRQMGHEQKSAKAFDSFFKQKVKLSPANPPFDVSLSYLLDFLAVLIGLTKLQGLSLPK